MKYPVNKTAEWNDLFRQKNHTSLIINAMNSMQQSLNKVVLACTSIMDCQNHQLIIFDPIAIRKHLQLLFFHPKYDLWMGATPERLISMQQSYLTTMALAGTRPLGSSSWG